MQEVEATPLESISSNEASAVQGKLPAWLKLGAIAAASALAGGLAAAWYYRKTLDTLRKADFDSVGQTAEIQEDASDSDT